MRTREKESNPTAQELREGYDELQLRLKRSYLHTIRAARQRPLSPDELHTIWTTTEKIARSLRAVENKFGVYDFNFR